jgi:hypothetical protein
MIFKTNKNLIHYTIQMNLENILNEKAPSTCKNTTCVVRFYLYGIPTIGISERIKATR